MALLFSFVTGGCENLPRDPNRTTEKIRESKVLVAGLAEGHGDFAAVSAREKKIVEMVARRLGARVEWRFDNAHALLQDLEEGHLPIVAAALPSSTPFAASIGLSKPILKKGPNQEDYCLAVAPGENRLLLLVDQIIAEEQKANNKS